MRPRSAALVPRVHAELRQIAQRAMARERQDHMGRHAQGGCRPARNGAHHAAASRWEAGHRTPYLASDAYATGEALYTFPELDVPASLPAMQRRMALLLRTQRNDGSWHVKSRAMKVQPYFESGFPHGHDQWISQAGTAWAAMALSRTAVATAPATRSAR